MSLNLKCYARLNHAWKSPLEAILIAFVPSTEVRTVRMMGNRPESLHCGTPTVISQDAIVRLQTYDKDKLYQVPLECVEIVDEWDNRHSFIVQ